MFDENSGAAERFDAKKQSALHAREEAAARHARQEAAARANEREKMAHGARSRQFLADHIPAEIVERFRVMTNTKAFREMDANNDGVITRQELRDACARWHLPAEAVERVLSFADADHDGNIDFGEFVAMFDVATADTEAAAAEARQASYHLAQRGKQNTTFLHHSFCLPFY